MTTYRFRPWAGPRLCPACGSYKIGHPDDAPDGEMECFECGWYGTEAQTIPRRNRGEYFEEAE